MSDIIAGERTAWEEVVAAATLKAAYKLTHVGGEVVPRGAGRAQSRHPGNNVEGQEVIRLAA